jgi:hypothetical protein
MKRPARPKARPVIYAIFYGAMVRVARRHGYALALHGSLRRDCDLVAIPWIEKASRPDVLIAALADRLGGVIPDDGNNPEVMPHGRLAWSIHVGSGAYMDVSVMPKVLR